MAASGQYNKNMKKSQRGYIALVTVLIVSVLAIFIASSANLFSISEAKMSLQEEQSWQAFYFALACAEEALMGLKDDLGYLGDKTLTFNGGSCYILQPEGSGNENRTVKTTGNAANQTRKIKIEIATINPEMDIVSWQEVAGF